MAEEEGVIIPKKEWWHFRDWLSRQDELIQVVAELLKENVKLLKVIAGEDGEPPIPPDVIPVTIRLDKIFEILIRDYPNYINTKNFDTSVLTWKKLEIHGTGFAIYNIGGGFDFRLNNVSGAIIPTTAGDKYDIEFSDIVVRGAGAGTGQIIYWRRN